MIVHNLIFILLHNKIAFSSRVFEDLVVSMMLGGACIASLVGKTCASSSRTLSLACTDSLFLSVFLGAPSLLHNFEANADMAFLSYFLIFAV